MPQKDYFSKIELHGESLLGVEKYTPSEPIIPKPTYFKTAANKLVDSIDFEGSAVNQVAKEFEFNQGFRGKEPLILVSTNFTPLYGSGEKNETGKSLKLKNDSKILNSKTALLVFSQSKGLNEFFDDHKDQLLEFVYEQDSSLFQISNAVSEAISSLDLSEYKDVIKNSGEETKEISFISYLKQNGYENANEFSNTKLWQQSLIELKRSLMSHSWVIVGNSPRTISDKDPWKLYGLTSNGSNSNAEKRSRIWFNPYVSMPNIRDFFVLPDRGSTESSIKEKINSFKSLISDLDSAQFVDLSINADLPIRTSDTNDKNSTQLSSGDLREFSKKFQTSAVLDKFSTRGIDISIIANMIFKEYTHSRALFNQYNDFTRNLPEYGAKNAADYSSSASGDNFVLWDHVIGRFQDDVRKISKSPIGNGNSLASFSQLAEDEYQVLTFERSNYIEGDKNFTPGNLYYVESSLNTVGLTEIDFSRLDDLINSSKKAKDTFDRIYNFMGYSAFGGAYNDYKKTSSVYSDYTFTLKALTKKLSIVSDVYKSCLDIKDKSIVGFNVAKLMSLDIEKSVGVRIAAVICKNAIDVSVKQSFYGQIAGELKSLLFMWLMNTVIYKDQRDQVAATASETLKSIIFEKLDIQIGNQWVASAYPQGRTFPFELGNVIQNESNSLDEVAYKEFATKRIFELNTDKGLWKVIVDLLSEMYKSAIFTTGGSGSGLGYTGYSGISKTAYMYAYFDLILRIISAQTPESILGTYNTTYEAAKGTTIKERGMVLSPVSEVILSNYYRYDLVTDPNSFYYNDRLENSLSYYEAEENYTFESIKLFMNYVKRLNSKLNEFKDALSKHLMKYTNNVANFFSATSLSNLSPIQISALFNLSISQEQVVMNRYIMDEYRDRFKTSTDAESKLKRIPEFSKLKPGFSTFLNVSDTELVSYDLLSQYFSSEDFEQVKANNKKIVSIGFPPKLIKYLRSIRGFTGNIVNRALENIVRVRLYKVDRLRPTIVYKPKQYLFEMTRFPTRALVNWNVDAIKNDNTNILRMPTKLFDVKTNQFRTCLDFTTAFPSEIYGDVNQKPFDQSVRLSIYENHVKSFLVEEYMRWMSNIRLDETKYHQYNRISSGVNMITDQYTRYLEYLNKNIGQISLSPAVNKVNNVTLTFTDPVSKTKYNIPVTSNDKFNSERSSSQPLVQETSDKSFELDMDSTMNSYFQNELIISDVNDDLKKRASLPKKFDRVFNVIFDPDEFEIESYFEGTNLQEAKSQGLLISENGTYRHRDTSPNDVTFDEYFVTVEPFDYVLPTR